MNIKILSGLSKKKTKWVPLLFFLLQLGVMILIEWFPPEVPSQFSNRAFLEFLWESGFIKPLGEELVFRILALPLFLLFITFGCLSREEGVINQLKREIKFALTLTRQGVRFPYKFQWDFPEDYDLIIFLVLTSVAFGLYHIPGYGFFLNSSPHS